MGWKWLGRCSDCDRVLLCRHLLLPGNTLWLLFGSSLSICFKVKGDMFTKECRVCKIVSAVHWLRFLFERSAASKRLLKKEHRLFIKTLTKMLI